jgi:tetratricopeptide (TPR) repeat protein
VPKVGREAGNVSHSREWWAGVVLILAVAVAYANSLSNPFVLDDQAAIVANASIRDTGRLSAALTPAADSPVAGRPVANVSFALNYAAGGLDVRDYRVVNIAIHGAVALLLLTLWRRTLMLPAIPEPIRVSAMPIAFTAALLWAVHPLNSEVINYLSQRTETLMAFFFALTMYASMQAGGVRSTSPRAERSAKARWEAAAVVACALGMMSKESMVAAPVVVALFDRVFLFGSWKDAVAARKRLYAGLAATWLVLAALVAAAPRSSVAGFSAGVPVWTNLLNQAVVIVEYLRLAFWPRDLVAFYGWHLPLTLGDVLPQMILITLLLVAALVALVRRRWAGFLGAWFFITLAPSSSIVPIATEVGAERRMYLPLMALILLAVLLAFLLVARMPRRWSMKAATLVVGVAAAGLIAATVARNREYASLLTLAETIVERRPTSVAYHFLGEQLDGAGREAEAVVALREAVVRGNSRAGLPLGTGLVGQREYAEAIKRLDAFIGTSGQRLTPSWLEPPVQEVVAARLVMGKALLATGDAERAALQAETVLAAYPRHVEAHALLGDARYAQQRWPAAVAAYRGYLSARPTDVQALISFGVASVATGAMDEAIAAFERAAAVEPGNERARQLLAMAVKDRAQQIP